MTAARTVVGGLGTPESLRWHEGNAVAISLNG
jgi:hypothetical protein